MAAPPTEATTEDPSTEATEVDVPVPTEAADAVAPADETPTLATEAVAEDPTTASSDAAHAADADAATTEGDTAAVSSSDAAAEGAADVPAEEEVEVDPGPDVDEYEAQAGPLPDDTLARDKAESKVQRRTRKAGGPKAAILRNVKKTAGEEKSSVARADLTPTQRFVATTVGQIAGIKDEDEAAEILGLKP